MRAHTSQYFLEDFMNLGRVRNRITMVAFIVGCKGGTSGKRGIALTAKKAHEDQEKYQQGN